MTTLGAYPVFRMTGTRENPDNLLEILAFLDSTDVNWILLIDSAVDVSPRTWTLTAEPLLCTNDLVQDLPATNALTGTEAPAGIRLCRRAQVLANRSIPQGDVLVPVFCGTWDAAQSPKGAFLAGFRHGQFRIAEASLSDARQRQLAFEASAGAHHRYGMWWMLGVLSGCDVKAKAGAAWAELATLDSDPDALARALRDLARRVRDTKGLPVAPLSADASRWAATIRSEWPSLHVWETFADRCGGLGPEGDRLANAYRAAGRRIWAATAPKPMGG